MKTISIFVTFLILLSQAFALTPEERMQQREKLREEMHQKLRQSLLHGTDPTPALNDMSRLMDSLMEDSLNDMDSLSRIAPSAGFSAFGRGSLSQVSLEWSESPQGRSLLVKPSDKEAKLDVQVNGEVISIKMDLAKKANGSSFSGQTMQTQTIPSDCDGEQVKIEAKDSGLVLFFPYKGKAPKLEKDRSPLPANPNDIQT